MDKSVSIIEQVSKSGGFVFVGIGLLFILIAVVVGVFKKKNWRKWIWNI
jgi:LPXTG-motif cell wall-anchored protein